ncbi:MAG: septum formation inhibitor Maf [Acidobacteria bacterium]|nr:septum formation inhibitor Maf [Acidobacteriota bacterium]
MSRIVLASSSPRRISLLKMLGVTFEPVPASIVEEKREGEEPADFARRIAKEKAFQVAERVKAEFVIAADTVVVIDGEVLGKPEDENEARRMLEKLSGRTHKVITAVALYKKESGELLLDHKETLVRFTVLSKAEIDWYIRTGEPMDKAGAYGIQGLGSLFIERIDGCYTNVVGLPLPLLYQLAKRAGLSLISPS